MAEPRRLVLSKSVVDSLSCPPGQKDALVFDSEVKGLALRLTVAGAKVFLFQYRAGTAIRRYRIGKLGDVTPAEARRRARILLGRVTAGGDPVIEDEQQAAATEAARAAARLDAKAKALTFEVLIDRWQRQHLVKRGELYRKDAPATLRFAFAGWKARPAKSVTRGEVMEQLDRIGAARGPGAARHAYAYGRAMYGWAMRRELVEANPFSGIEAPEAPADRDRVLTDAELGAIWTAAGGLGAPFGPFLQLLCLTLQRREEVAGMCWSELAEDLSVWTLPAERAKNSRAHLVHLAPAARAILAGLPRLEGCDLVFPTSRRNAPAPKEGEARRFTSISGYSAMKRRLDTAITKARAKAGTKPAELPDWRLHDFRRTGVTRLAELGVPPHVADRLLNHVQGAIKGVAAVYQRHDFAAERQEALRVWAKHVLKLAPGKTVRGAGKAGRTAKA
jgi:integrase